MTDHATNQLVLDHIESIEAMLQARDHRLFYIGHHLRGISAGVSSLIERNRARHRARAARLGHRS